MKILYTGLQYNYYNPKRGVSFEHENFYGSIRSFPGASVEFFPFERILEVGKRQWNAELLERVQQTGPDALFAFMFSDEFDRGTLDEIKKHTVSIAWFADDHWRIENYSRLYAPHFTWNVTTWSKGPERYARHGIRNVIRSQWASNPNVWKPVEAARDLGATFVGQTNPSRRAVVEGLRSGGVRVVVRGAGWPEGRLPTADMVAFFSRSKVNLNINTPVPRFSPAALARLALARSRAHIRPNLVHPLSNIRSWLDMRTPQIKARPFEILACRTFLISGYADDMERYYRDGKEIVYYDGTIPDLAGKIRYYLSHDAERERIAEAAYRRTLAEHTYEARFREIFKRAHLL